MKMSYYLLRAILGASVFSVCCAGLDITDFFGPSILKRDCAFSHWGSWQGCRLTSSGTFEHTRTRSIVHPRGGGRPCPRVRVLSQTQTCSQIKVQVEKFISSLVSSKPASSKGPLKNVVGVQQYVLTSYAPPCREWRVNGKLVMGGGKCKAPSVSRKRRSADVFLARERYKRASVPTLRHMDLLLLLDESYSVIRYFHGTIKFIAKAIVKSLCDNRVLKPDRTRISVASFDRANHVHFYLKNGFMSDPGAAIEAIDRIKYDGTTDGSTCLASALKHSKTHMFQTTRGARLDSKTEQQVVVITDGCANCAQNSLSGTAQALYGDKIAISTIFIGGDKKCLDTIQNLENSAEKKCWNLYSLETWTLARQFAQTLWDLDTCVPVLSKLTTSCY